MLVDIHSHILPQIDDGATGMEESMQLLKALQAQGAQAVWATPHFYAHLCNLEDYTTRVQAAYAQVRQQAAEQGLPPVHLGYEVKYFKGMAENSVLEQLTMEDTGYILVELPYQDVDPAALEEICQIGYNTGLTPILAHIDRYFGYRGYDYILQTVKSGDVLAQVNADSLLYAPFKRQTLKLFKQGYVSFIGSDTHNLGERAPHLAEAVALLQKKWGKPQTEAFLQRAASLITQK